MKQKLQKHEANQNCQIQRGGEYIFKRNHEILSAGGTVLKKVMNVPLGISSQR